MLDFPNLIDIRPVSGSWNISTERNGWHPGPSSEFPLVTQHRPTILPPSPTSPISRIDWGKFYPGLLTFEIRSLKGSLKISLALGHPGGVILGVGGLPHKKMGALIGKFEKNP